MQNDTSYLSGPKNLLEARERIFAAIVTLVPMLAAVLGVYWVSNFGIGLFEVLCFLFFYILGEIGAEVGLHRYFSHRAFAAGSLFKKIITVLASIGGKGTIFEFAAVHRRHHLYADHTGDPHSPYEFGSGIKNSVAGFFHSYYLWIYRIRMSPAEHVRVLDLLQDKILVRWGDKRMYYFWLVLGALTPALIGYIYYQELYGFYAGLLWGGGIRIFFQQHSAFAINSVCHLWGSRPFPTRDESRNNALLAYLTLGVGWHNNHHAFPYTASNQFHWWQLDLCGLFLKICVSLNLVTDLKFPSQKQRENFRAHDDSH